MARVGGARRSALEQGILRDLCAAGAMTTEQVRRLRFPGSGVPTCRLRLAAMRARGLVAELQCRWGHERQVVWLATERGAAAVGLSAPGTWDPSRFGPMLAAAEHFVEETLARLTTP